MTDYTLLQDYDNGLIGMAAGVKVKKHIIKSHDEENNTIEVVKVEEFPAKEDSDEDKIESEFTYTLHEEAVGELKGLQGEVVDETGDFSEKV